MTLKSHPYADMFPLISGQAFEDFAADIRDKGQRNKIVLLDGMILDGRNRYRAAVLHGLPAAQGDADCFRDFDPTTEGDPLDWVLSQNLARRHLDESQRAMVAENLANVRQGQRTDVEHSADLPKVDQAEAARRLNVSTRLVTAARAVKKTGTPELVELVEQGGLSVTAAAQAAKLDPEQQARVVALAGEGKANVVRTVIKQGARNVREQDLATKQKALPDKKFGIILADPEHRFDVYSRETGLDRAADNHYPTSEQRLLLMREIPKISAKDCMCVLWVTDLARGVEMLRSWGFTFKSYRVWAKDIVPGPRNKKGQRTWVEVGPAGTGFWFRDRDELVLIGTRGNFVAPAMGTQPESILFAARPKEEGTKRGRHSAKPEEVHLWIEENWPNTPKIELNARAARPGWEVWGNEAPQDAGNNSSQNITDIIQDEIPAGSHTEQPGQPDEQADVGAQAPSAVSAQDATGEGPGGQEQDAQPEADAVASASAPVSEDETPATPTEMYARAKALVIKEQIASCSYLQRTFDVSYGDAYAILDMMEQEGIVTAPDERNARKVLIQPEARWKTGHLMGEPEAGAAKPAPGSNDTPMEIPAFLRREPAKVVPE